MVMPSYSGELRPKLVDFLDRDMTPLKLKDVKGTQSKKYLKKWRNEAASARRLLSDVKTFTADASRDPEGTYDSALFADAMPSPTTQNRRFIVFGGHSCNKAPLEGRYVSQRERARSMGYDFPGQWEKLLTLTPGQLQKALGNTILLGVARAALRTVWEYIDMVQDIVGYLPASPQPPRGGDDSEDDDEHKTPTKRIRGKQNAVNALRVKVKRTAFLEAGDPQAKDPNSRNNYRLVCSEIPPLEDGLENVLPIHAPPLPHPIISVNAQKQFSLNGFKCVAQ